MANRLVQAERFATSRARNSGEIVAPEINGSNLNFNRPARRFGSHGNLLPRMKRGRSFLQTEKHLSSYPAPGSLSLENFLTQCQFGIVWLRSISWYRFPSPVSSQ
jgi:hypothetical protein